MKYLLMRFREKKIIVIGDLMLDEYLWGDTRRISPEAPVPVVDVDHQTYAPGGACNTAMNVSSLGGIAVIGGVVGDDSAADCLKKELTKFGIDISGIITDPSRPTITKTRILARNQQVVRVDREKKTLLNPQLQKQILTWLEKALPQSSACIFSDYQKGLASPGFLAELFMLGKELDVPVFVDPKGNQYSRYNGAFLITPNRLEAEIATGIEPHSGVPFEELGSRLREHLPGTHILIKLGAQGMALFPVDSTRFVHIPAVARQVFDVTGAGDTVIASLALAFAAGANLEQAVHLSNVAAGVVVGKVGTATVSVEELHEAIG